MRNLRYYIDLFSKLSVSNRDSKQTPHKAVLLISIINHIQAGVIDENRVELSEDLELTFASNWRKFVGNSSIFNCNIAAPYFFMASEPFWHLVKTELYEEKKSYTVKELRTYFKYAEIDRELYYLLKDVNNSACLTVLLITKYISQLYDLNIPIKSGSTKTGSNPLIYSFNDVHICEYTPRSIFVYGNTKQYKEQFKELSGIFKPKGLNGGPGWIFSKRRMSDVKELLSKTLIDDEISIVKSSTKDTKLSLRGYNDAFVLVAKRLDEGWNYDMILEELTPLYKSDPIRYGTPSGLMITKATLSNWAKKIGYNYNSQNSTQAKKIEWMKTSIGFQWFKQMVLSGASESEIINKFNELHKRNPSDYSTFMGFPLTTSTYIRWRKEVLQE